MREYRVVVGIYHTYAHEPKHSHEERVFQIYPSKAKAEEIAEMLFGTGNYDTVRVTHKNWNTVKGTKVYARKEARKDTLKEMDKIITNLGDEDYWWDWIALGVPDGATESTYDDIADDTECFKGIVHTFFRLIKAYEENEKETIKLNKMYLF